MVRLRHLCAVWHAPGYRPSRGAEGSALRSPGNLPAVHARRGTARRVPNARQPDARICRTGASERWETPSQRLQRRGYRRRSAWRSWHPDTDLPGKNRHLPERWAKPCGFRALSIWQAAGLSSGTKEGKCQDFCPCKPTCNGDLVTPVRESAIGSRPGGVCDGYDTRLVGGRVATRPAIRRGGQARPLTAVRRSSSPRGGGRQF